MSFPGMELPKEVRKKAWDHAVRTNGQDVAIIGMDPQTLYAVQTEYEKAIEAYKFVSRVFGEVKC